MERKLSMKALQLKLSLHKDISQIIWLLNKGNYFRIVTVT